MIEWIGSTAAILTTLSFLPQVIRTWRTKSTDDFSWIWLVAFASGLTLWLVYGVLIWSLPLIFANMTTLFFVLLIALIKFRAP